MYQALCKLMLLRLKSPHTSLLASYQGGGTYHNHQSHGTMVQCSAIRWGTLCCPSGHRKGLPQHSPPTAVGDHVLGGPPPPMIAMLRQAYSQTRSDTPTISTGGSKKAAPFPHLFCVVYEIFHRTLSLHFPEVKFFVYMDDIALVSPDWATPERVLAQVSELSRILGFRVNSGKTEIYRWSPDPVNESIVWEGIPNKVRPLILQYLGHILAPPNWAHKARSYYMGVNQSALAAYIEIPMDGWGRAQLVNSLLVPRWLHCLLLLLSDKTLHQIDTMISDFVRDPNGMETSRNRHQLSTPVCQGGLGLHSIFWAYRRCFIMSMQRTIRVHP